VNEMHLVERYSILHQPGNGFQTIPQVGDLFPQTRVGSSTYTHLSGDSGLDFLHYILNIGSAFARRNRMEHIRAKTEYWSAIIDIPD